MWEEYAFLFAKPGGGSHEGCHGTIFGDVEPFFSTHDDFAPATRQKLLAILTDPAKNACLRIELAAVVDAGECLVKTTCIQARGRWPSGTICI